MYIKLICFSILIMLNYNYSLADININDSEYLMAHDKNYDEHNKQENGLKAEKLPHSYTDFENIIDGEDYTVPYPEFNRKSITDEYKADDRLPVLVVPGKTRFE